MTEKERFKIKWQMSRDFRNGYMESHKKMREKIVKTMNNCSDHHIYMGLMIARDIIESEMEVLDNEYDLNY